MKLVKVKLQNFRCYKNETTIDLDDLTVFIGKNDSGKSTIFDALDIFFNEPKGAPDPGDLNVFSDSTEFSITCVFDNLPKTLVIDATHPTTVKDEYMLNEGNLLEIKKVFRIGSKVTTKVYAIAYHPSSKDFNDLLLLSNANLKKRAKELGIDLTKVNQSINTELRRAIWAHSDNLQPKVSEIELSSETAKAIWDQLKIMLPVFAVFKVDRPSTDQDAEAQDPMKSAIKEAIKEQEKTLEQITKKVKDEVQDIANRTVEKIREMCPELASQLKPQIKNKNWDSLFSVSLTSDDDIPINKRGSGTRRLILLNFFRAKAEREAELKKANVIYAIEEPETSQHPNNQKLLTNAFQDLVENLGCQVLLTTHSPSLSRRFDQNKLRFIFQKDSNSTILHGRENSTIEVITKSLGVLPDHGIKVFVGVEGRNDINFLRNISKILHDAGEDIPDLFAAEDLGALVFIPIGGSNIDLWISKLRELNVPELYIFDRDTSPPVEPHHKNSADQINQRSGCKAWHTSKKTIENYIHPDVIKQEYGHYLGTGGDFEDVPSLFAQAVYEASNNEKPWSDIVGDKENYDGKIKNAKRRLCDQFVAKMTPVQLTQVDRTNDIRNWLSEISVFLK